MCGSGMKAIYFPRSKGSHLCHTSGQLAEMSQTHYCGRRVNVVYVLFVKLIVKWGVR